MSIRSRFLKLLLGPVITLLVGVLSGPVISRLFTPEDFGRYSVLLGIVGLGVVAVTARFEQLIPSSRDPQANFWLVLVASLVGASVLGLGACFFFTPQEAAFVAAATLSVAVFNGFYYLQVHAERPLRASAGRATQASGVLGGQVALGVSGWGMPGLMWGELAGRLLSLLVVMKKVEARCVRALKVAFLEQFSAVKWLLPGALLGALALQLLPLGMTSSVGAASAGIFLLVYRMVVIPNSLLSKVASDTMLVELGRLNKSGEEMGEIVELGLGKLVLAALCFYGALAVFGGWIFTHILGEQWGASAELVPWLALLVGFWSVAAPMAMVFVSLGKTYWSFGFSALDVMNRSAALIVGYIYQDAYWVAVVLGLGGVVVYSLSVLSALTLARARIARALAPVSFHILAVLALLFASWQLFVSGFFAISVSLALVAFLLTGKKVVYG